MELVRAIVGSELSVEDIMELEQEALAETGNIMLNACLIIANQFERSLRISLPEVIHGEGTESNTTNEVDYINRTNEARQPQGHYPYCYFLIWRTPGSMSCFFSSFR